jgi:hypothetical protein
LSFGPDGFLYIGSGDGGSRGDPDDRGQNLDTLLGKLLRIDVDEAASGRNYSVPASNPFAADLPAGCTDSCVEGPCGSTCDEIWAYGLRNPWRFSFDRQTGGLYLGDVGQASWEEVDYRSAASAGGENYGWRVMEGTHCYPPDPMEQCTPPTDHVPPILEYEQSTTPGCSVTGGFTYRGSAFPQLQGVYLYGDYCFGTIWGAAPDCNGDWQSRVLLDTPFSIASFGEDELGELLVADLADGSGEVYRLGLTATSGGPDLELFPSPIDFGAPPGASLEVTLSNNNPGPEALRVRDLALADGTDFALNVNGGSAPCGTLSPCLGPGQSCTLELLFSGTGQAWFVDRLLTASNSALTEVEVGACTAPVNLVVSDDTEVSEGVETFDACETLTVGTGFLVTSTGVAILRAGDLVSLKNGTMISGGLEIRSVLP